MAPEAPRGGRDLGVAALLSEVGEGLQVGLVGAVARITPHAAVGLVRLADHWADEGAVPFAGEGLPVKVVGGGRGAFVGAGAAAMLVHDDAADGLHALGQPEVVGRGEDEFAGLV